MTETADTITGAPPRQQVVLIVDDVVETRYAFRRHLERAGYIVWEASSGEHAVRLARAGPDIVTLDVQLVDVDGLEICRRLRADPLTSALPIIQYSRVARDTTAQTTGLDAGADADLIDPEPQVLVATIASILRQRRAEADVRILAALAAALDNATTLDERIAAAARTLVPARATSCTIDLARRSDPSPPSSEVPSPPGSIALPLVVRGTRIGTLHLGGLALGEPPRDRPWLDAIADRIAVSLDNAGLLAHAVHEAQRQRNLQEFATSLAATTTREQIAFAVALRGSDTVDATFSNIAIVNAAGDLELIHGPTLDDEIADRWLVIDRHVPVPLADAIRSGQPVFLASLEEVTERYPSLLADTVAAGLQATASIPIADASGAIVASMGIGWSTPITFTDDISATIETLASITGQALERADVFEREQTVQRRLRTIQSLLRRLSESTTADEVTSVILDELSALPTVAHATVALDTAHLRPAVDGDAIADGATSEVTVAKLDALERAGRERRDIVVRAASPTRTAIVAVPLIVGDNRQSSIGVTLTTPDVDESTLDILRTSATLGSQALRRALTFDHAHDVAQRLQESLLPQALPHLADLELGSEYRPAGYAQRVGGDWYDAIALDDHRTALVIGDVAGHGIASAAFMGRLRHTVAAFATTPHTPLSLVTAVDRVASTTGIEMATMLYVVIDDRTGTASWCSAGHLPAVAVRANGDTELLLGGLRPPLGFGLDAPADFREGTAQLERGDCIVLYTDGLIERRTEPLDQSLQRLEHQLQANHPLRLERLDAHIVRPLTGNRPADDVAILVARRRVHADGDLADDGTGDT